MATITRIPDGLDVKGLVIDGVVVGPLFGGSVPVASGAQSIPEVSGLTPRDAALAYGDAGWYVLPIAVGKHPGSVVGTGWPDKSSNDPDQIRRWWIDFPAAGIALHTGRSGVVAFDLDVDLLPDELAWLNTGLFQSSRSGRGARGHYVFASPDTFANNALRLNDGTHVGEVRSGNSVIMVQPSPHPKTANGGGYVWQRFGPAPELPQAARRYLTTKAGCDETITPTDVAAWCKAHSDERESWRRHVFRDKYRAKIDGGEKRHAVMMAVLGWAAREVHAGLVAGSVFDDLYKDWLASFRDTDRVPDRFEFDQMLRTAIIDLDGVDADDLRNRARRDFGTDHRESKGVFDDFLPSERKPEDKVSQSDSEQATTAGEGESRRNAPLDLLRLRTEPPAPIAWLWPDVIPTDSYVSLSAAPGTGKSILARGIAVDASQGRSHTDPSEAVEPARVLYLDAENGQDWWRDGLNAMRAPLDLPNLAVVCFPDLGGLDTAKGAGEFLMLVRDVSDDFGGIDLVVLDTVSRFIDGGENDADTWSQFYRRAIQPLREQRIAVLRLDHLGKDADRGPRGSSHKLADVDADYRLTADKPGGDDLMLALGKRRRQHFVSTLRLRRYDAPLRHQPSALVGAFALRAADGSVVPVDRSVAGLVAELDRLNIDTALGRPKAQAAYAEVGGMLSTSAANWSAAIKFRRDRASVGQRGSQQST